MSNQRLPSTGYVLLNKSARKLEQAVTCGTKPQIGKAVQIPENILIVRSIIGFFATLKLLSLQYPMIVSKPPLMRKQPCI